MSHPIMNRLKIDEKYFVIVSVPMIFLGVVLVLAGMVYHSNIAISLRRNNIGGANYYREVSNFMFSNALFLFGISAILLLIAYYIANRR
jgi:hypothetical protein